MGSILFAFSAAILYYMSSWVGTLFVQSELPRESNERLLNDLKEGLFIIDEQDSQIIFRNKAAKRINDQLETECDVTLISDRNMFNRAIHQFWPIDPKEMLNSDDIDKKFKEIVLQESNDCFTIDQIIAKSISEHGKKSVYRVMKLENH